MGTVKERLGRNVRARREQIGLSQAKLAEAVGKTDTSIGLLERGKVWPEFESLTAIADTLNCSVDDFFADVKPTPDATATDLLDILKQKNAEITRLKAELERLQSAKVTPIQVPETEEEKMRAELAGIASQLNAKQLDATLKQARTSLQLKKEREAKEGRGAS